MLTWEQFKIEQLEDIAGGTIEQLSAFWNLTLLLISIKMALASLLLNDIFDDMGWPHQHRGMRILNDDLIKHPVRVRYYKSKSNAGTLQNRVSNIQNDKDGLKMNLDVQQFKPEELVVKVVDGCVTVEGKHEDRQDEQGVISRQFQQRYKLPKDVDPAEVISQLSSDGVLTVSVPKKALPQPNNERIVPITQLQDPQTKL